MGQIIGSAAKPKRCNLNKLSQLEILAAGEHVLVSSDNSMNAAGQGNFDSYIIGDGSHAATALELKSVDNGLGEEVSQLQQEVASLTGGAIEKELTWTTGERVSLSNGSDSKIVNATTDYAVSDYVEVENADWKLRVAGVHGLPSIETPAVNYYDADHKHIGYEYVNGSAELTIPSGVKYVLISQCTLSTYPTSGVSVKFVLPENIVTKTEFDYYADNVDAEFDRIDGELLDITGDTIPETLTWTIGKRVGLGESSDSKIANATTDYAISNFIENPGGAYKLRVSGVRSMSNIQTPSVNYYDADQKHIGYEYVDGSAELTVPVGVSYVLISQCDVTDYPTANVSVTFVVEPMFASKEDLDDLTEDFENAKSNSNNGYRIPTDADFTQSIDGHFKIENGSLYGERGSADPTVMMVFNESIKAVEFEIASLWDSNLISLVFGLGVDTGNNKPCFAQGYLNTSARPNDTGSVGNMDYDGAASAGQSTSIWGQGHFSGDYRQPQVKPYAVAVGDKCRIELIDGHYFKATVYNSTSGCWDFWWCLDTNGTWNGPKMGWTTRRAIGFEIKFATITTWKELVKNIRIVSEDGKTSGIYSELSNDFPERKQWVAIGDSITEIDKNNGLSYVGYAQRKLGFKVDNQGKGGWTIYKLWRDRATAGWESAVSAINDGDLVTILAGTNDFDTASFSTPVSDEAMDAAGNPHPRFGTTDPTSEDAKDPHTTLGCLRLMIERILTLKPGARLSVFSPFYREKGAPIGQTSWNKLYINSDGKTIYDYADAIYSVAREYNLPAYNTCRDCGINAMTLATYTYDDLHIGQVGGELIGDYVAKKIRP